MSPAFHASSCALCKTTRLITRDKWISAQLDGDHREIYHYIDTKELPLNAERAKMILTAVTKFCIQDRCLYYVDPITSRLRLVVPEEYQKQQFHERHGGVFGTHSSAVKIYDALRHDYYWSNMRSDCEKWCKECPVCAFTREPLPR